MLKDKNSKKILFKVDDKSKKYNFDVEDAFISDRYWDKFFENYFQNIYYSWRNFDDTFFVSPTALEKQYNNKL